MQTSHSRCMMAFTICTTGQISCDVSNSSHAGEGEIRARKRESHSSRRTCSHMGLLDISSYRGSGRFRSWARVARFDYPSPRCRTCRCSFHLQRTVLVGSSQVLQHLVRLVREIPNRMRTLILHCHICFQDAGSTPVPLCSLLTLKSKFVSRLAVRSTKTGVLHRVLHLPRSCIVPCWQLAFKYIAVCTGRS